MYIKYVILYFNVLVLIKDYVVIPELKITLGPDYQICKECKEFTNNFR